LLLTRLFFLISLPGGNGQFWPYQGLSKVFTCNFRELPANALALLQQGTAFHQPWFRDIASGRGTKVTAVATLDGEVAACLPYTITADKFFFFCADKAAWTHITGPVFAEGLDRSQKAEATRKLLAQLPHWYTFHFLCNPSDDNPILVDQFKAAGFTHTTQFTYHEYPTDPDVMDPNNEDGLDKKRRGNIRRAEKRVFIVEALTGQEFMRFYLHNLSAMHKTCSQDPSVLAPLIDTGQSLRLTTQSQKKTSGVMLFAAREKRETESKTAPLVAAIACLLDSNRLYYWLTTRRPSEGYDDTVKALIIRARQKARELGLIFDSNGADDEGSHTLFRRLKFPRELCKDIFTRPAFYDCRASIKTYIRQTRSNLSRVGLLCF
jgi:hypothetical protein